jgi:phosphoribosylformylglycinamidine synthase
VVHGHLGGLPPRADLEAEATLARLLQAGVGVLTSAHDLSEGGLAQALVECALRNDVGVSVSIPGDAFVGLFSESAGRVLVTVTDGDAERLVQLAAEHGVAIAPLGVTGGDTLAVDDQLEVPLAELREAWTATLPAALA